MIEFKNELINVYDITHIKLNAYMYKSDELIILYRNGEYLKIDCNIDEYNQLKKRILAIRCC